ncbi:MAG: phosphoribosylformylglycinamidine cyclo-ligase [Planctomycetota bacterium]
MARDRTESGKDLTYKAAGVDIAANDEMVQRIQHSLRRTYTPRVLTAANAFAGLFRLDYREKLLRRNYRDPVLVSGTDGVGSKLLLALEANRLDDVGIDLVAMSVNDVLTTGAEPLFFLDYVACHKLEPPRIAEIVDGISRGCGLAGCALLGGETAEMPELYAGGHYDLAGFCVGVVERRRIIDGREVEPGDVVLGLGSSGVHSNGYTLVRRLLEMASRGSPPAVDLGEPLTDAFLRPTRIYAKPILSLLGRYQRKRVVRAMAHITGGGLEGNLPRVLPAGCDAVVERGAWQIPPVFRWIQAMGVDEEEMYRVFNMGIGYVLVVRPAFAGSITRQLERLGETVFEIGLIRKGNGKLMWR